MDPEAAPTITSSACATHQPAPTHLLLEVSLISAQDLSPVSKSLRTYAMAWLIPGKKYTSRTDHEGHTHPTWNDKFTFRIDTRLLASDDAAITVEIYSLSWFRDILVGTVKVLIADLLSPPNGISLQAHPKNMRFVALQVRRPSGTPQGILNMGITLTDGSKNKKKKKNSIPLQPCDWITYPIDMEKKADDIPIPEAKNDDKELEEKINTWRLRSTDNEAYNEDFSGKPGSVYNGSMVNGSVCNSSIINGSELCSDIGPSASIVAAELAKTHQPLPGLRPTNQVIIPNKHQQADDTGSSILEELTLEEARAKGFKLGMGRGKWRHATSNDSDISSYIGDGHSRRNSDGGLFSCFGNAYGIEFRITCGANSNPSKSKPKQPTHSISRGKHELIAGQANSI